MMTLDNGAGICVRAQPGSVVLKKSFLQGQARCALPVSMGSPAQALLL